MSCGKTTTSGLIAQVLNSDELNSSYIIGADLLEKKVVVVFFQYIRAEYVQNDPYEVERVVQLDFR